MSETVEIPPRREAAEVVDDFCQTIDLLILADDRVNRSLSAELIRLFRAAVAACRSGVSIRTISSALILGAEGPEISVREPDPFDDTMEALYVRLCTEAYQTDFETIAAVAEEARARKAGAEGRASDRLLHNTFAATAGADCPEFYNQLLELVLHMRLVQCFDIHPRVLANTAQTLEDALRIQVDESPEEMVRGALDRARKLLGNRRLTKQLKTFELRFARKVLKALENGVSPVLIAALIKQEIDSDRWLKKSDAKTPEELVARLGMPRGGVFALQNADNEEAREGNQVNGALMMLAFLFDFRVTRRVVEEMGRTIDHFVREVEVNVN